MHDSPKGRGYVKIRETAEHPWTGSKSTDTVIAAHEFHYSSLANCDSVKYAYQVLRGTGIDGKHDGIVYKNVLGCYAHLRDVNCNHWVQRFLAFVQQIKTGNSEEYTS